MSCKNCLENITAIKNELGNLKEMKYGKKMMNHFKRMYNEQKFVRSKVKKIKVNKIIKSYGNDEEVEQSDLYNTIPEKIREYINSNVKYIFIFNCEIDVSNGGGPVDLTIYFYIEENDCLNLVQFERIANNIIILNYLLLLYSNSKPKKIDLHLYLTKFEKKYNDNKVLNKFNCNTAVTYSCQTNIEVVIYRKEEYFKVLIHELFHALCLDFSSFNCDYLKSKINELFPIKQKNLPYEAYAETWANIINCVFYAYNKIKNDRKNSEISKMKKFKTTLIDCLNSEILFSVFQMNKILNKMGLSYRQLMNKNNLYHEYTNVFSYYILKTILLFNAEDFINWCNVHNINLIEFRKTDEKIRRFTEFVEDKYDGNKFLNFIDKIKNKTTNNAELNQTLRMTIHDYGL